MNYPNESPQYRAARNELLAEEVELRRHAERVAAMRRALPPGGEVPQDYVFDDGDGAVRLSELFQFGRPVVAYGFMYGPKMAKPCPSCTSIIEALNASARHIAQRVNLVVVARSPIERILAFAKEKGWDDVRLLSSEKNSYNRDYFAETADGSQMPMLNVFTRKDGVVRHFYGTELLYAPVDPGQDPRHADSLWPLWGVLDMTPDGRGADFQPKLAY